MFAARLQAQMFRHLASGTVTQARHFTSCNCICGRCLSMLQTARPTMGCYLTRLFRQCVTEYANCRRRVSWKHKKQSWRFTRLFFVWHLILGRNCKAVGQVLHLLLQATHFLQDLSFRAFKLHMATYGQKNGNHFSDKIWNSEPPSSLLSLADGALPGPSFVQMHCKMQHKVDWTPDSNKNICQWQFLRQASQQYNSQQYTKLCSSLIFLVSNDTF